MAKVVNIKGEIVDSVREVVIFTRHTDDGPIKCVRLKYKNGENIDFQED